MSIKIEVFLCTHNPRLDILKIVIDSLAKQTLNHNDYRVNIIDNISNPPILDNACQPLKSAGIKYRIFVEKQLGNAYARAKAFEENTAKYILFVDDDTELSKNYVELSLKILSENPEIGCLGGKLLLAPGIHMPEWLKSLRLFLAIRDDVGDNIITKFSKKWTIAEPPSAGMAMHAEIGESYLNMSHLFPHIGRKGS